MSRRKKELANIAEEKSFIIVEMKKKGTETNLQLIWLLIDVHNVKLLYDTKTLL